MPDNSTVAEGVVVLVALNPLAPLLCDAATIAVAVPAGGGVVIVKGTGSKKMFALFSNEAEIGLPYQRYINMDETLEINHNTY